MLYLSIIILSIALIWLTFLSFTFLYHRYIYDSEMKNKDFQLKIFRDEKAILVNTINEERKERQELTKVYFLSQKVNE